MTRRALVIVGAAVAVFVGGVAFADSTTGSGSSFVDSLASHLGISKQKLQDAAKAAALDQVDQALADGKITKDRADELEQRINDGRYPLSDEGGFGLGGPRFGHGPFGGGPGFGFRFGFGLRGYTSAAADYLGVSEEDLLKKLQAGDSLADVAKAQGKSVDGLEDALKAAAKKQLDQAVTDKRITSDQEQEVLDRFDTALDEIVNAKMPFRASVGPRAMASGGRCCRSPAGRSCSVGPVASCRRCGCHQTRPTSDAYTPSGTYVVPRGWEKARNARAAVLGARFR